MAQALNQLVKPKKVPFSVAINSEGTKRMLETTLQDKKTREQFVTAIVAAVSANPTLGACEPSSILSAGLQGVALGLAPSPSLGQFYMIPYGNKATFQMGVNGWKQLAIRSGQYRDIDALVIRQGEYKGRDKDTGKPIFEFVEDSDEWSELPVMGYLAYFELLNGFRKSVYMSKAETLKHAQRYSKAFDRELYDKYENYLQTGEGLTEYELSKCENGWYGNFDGMSLKTCLIQLLKRWGVLSIDMQTAMDSEDSAPAMDGSVLTEQELPPNAKAGQAKGQPDTENKEENGDNAAETDGDDFFN